MSLHTYQIQQFYLGESGSGKAKNKQKSTNVARFAIFFSIPISTTETT
jgi:hypothetical protein